MYLEGLKDYIQNVDNIKNPQLKEIQSKIDLEGVIWTIFECLDNSKKYFTMQSKDKIISAELNSSMAEEISKIS